MQPWRYARIAAFLALSGCQTPEIPSTFVEKACAAELEAAGARCGTVEVPENHDAPGSRTLALNVLVLPALEPDGNPDAQFELEGGPGFAATDLYEFYLTDGRAYRTRRDIVFVDMRGTGQSGALRCPGIEADEAADPWNEMYPPELVSECRRELASHADLDQYTTRNASLDLEQVRKALGYESVSISAISYGTQLALSYMAMFPERVDRAVLFGTVSPEAAPPSAHAQSADAALRSVVAACQNEPACAAAYPDPLTDLSATMRALGPAAGHADVFAEWLRTQMYSPITARRIPQLLRASAEGELPSLGGGGAPQRIFADGLYLSITCAESFPAMDFAAMSAAARETFFSDYRLRRQKAACDIWGSAPSAVPVPQDSPVPVLFVSGEFDPVTPPGWADSLLERFKSAHNLVLKGSGHDIGGMSGLDTCLDPLLLGFLNGAALDELDFSCAASMKAPDFAVP
jgi:pimeloyl-ACP methyl ester carboxylesterase